VTKKKKGKNKMMKDYTKEKMIMINTEGNKNVSSCLALITASFEKKKIFAIS